MRSCICLSIGCWRVAGREMIGGVSLGQFREARSVVIVPTVVVTVPIPVMIPVVVPVVIGVLHSFAVAAGLVPLGLHDDGDRTRRYAEPISAAAIVPNIIRRISHSPLMIAGANYLLNEPEAAWRPQPDQLMTFSFQHMKPWPHGVPPAASADVKGQLVRVVTPRPEMTRPSYAKPGRPSSRR
jgi:hypothetical protein